MDEMEVGLESIEQVRKCASVLSVVDGHLEALPKAVEAVDTRKPAECSGLLITRLVQRLLHCGLCPCFRPWMMSRQCMPLASRSTRIGVQGGY